LGNTTVRTTTVSGVCGKRLQRRKVGRGLLQDRGCTNRRRTSLAQQYYRRQTKPHSIQTTSTLHRKHGRLLLSPRHRQGRLSLRMSIYRTTDPFGAIMRRKRRIRDERTALHNPRRSKTRGRWNQVQQLTHCAQQLAIGVLSTMFGGVFLLSGGSSKAVQQSPPIKASSRGEEDFIQYVPKYHTRHHPNDAHTER
jgi:hypothetical protein